MSRSSPVLLISANIAAFVATVLINALAGVGAINNITTAKVSDTYFTLITPAGYVFSIWGIIYVLLLVFAIFQALPSQRDKPFLREVGFLFVLSSVFNVSWILLWQYEYVTLSVILIFALLATLIAIYLRLKIGKSSVSLREKLAVHLPFSVYLGWITIATIADVAAALVSVNWNGTVLDNVALDYVTWATLVISVALIITLGVIFTRKDIAYGLVVIWALVGIMVNHSDQMIYLAAGMSAVITALALVVMILVSVLSRRSQVK